MDASFFSARPSVSLRLKIGRVLTQFRGGIHKSRVIGGGHEFRGFRPWSSDDSPSRINYPASYKLSPDLDEVVVRTSYGEKRTSVVVVFDARATMLSPSQKMVHAGSLFWLFALSAFQAHDRFRAMFMLDSGFVDSGWVSKEDNLAEFLDQDILGRRASALFLRAENPLSLLVDERTRDAFLIVLSDFCTSWDKEITAFSLLGAQENNIHGAFLAMDEWAGSVSLGYSMNIRDLRTGVFHRMTSGDLDEAARAACESYLRFSRKLDQHSASFIKIPLTNDPIASFCRAALGFELKIE
ncbi:MAG: DUF58 domain-containing protein [bacterium]|nr:DUF58 domain-containing protein [bacterium]